MAGKEKETWRRHAIPFGFSAQGALRPPCASFVPRGTFDAIHRARLPRFRQFVMKRTAAFHRNDGAAAVSQVFSPPSPRSAPSRRPPPRTRSTSPDFGSRGSSSRRPTASRRRSAPRPSSRRISSRSRPPATLTAFPDKRLQWPLCRVHSVEQFPKKTVRHIVHSGLLFSTSAWYRLNSSATHSLSVIPTLKPYAAMTARSLS